MTPTATAPSQTLANVLQLLRAHRADLFARYPLRTLAIFGSVSRGDNGPESDVDIMVELAQPLGLGFVRLAYELEDLLGTKVDLVTRRAIKERYFIHIEPDLKYV